MKNRMVSRLLIGVILLPALGQAKDLSYTYVEAGPNRSEIDNRSRRNVDGDGFAIAGSLAVAPQWHVFADISRADYDFGIDSTTVRVGGGYNYGINTTTDVIARVAFVSASVDVPTPFGDLDDDADGLGIGVGLRSEIIPKLEIEGALDYVDLGGGNGSNTTVTGQGRYFIKPMFSVGGSVTIGDDVTMLGVAARLNFR